MSNATTSTTEKIKRNVEAFYDRTYDAYHKMHYEKGIPYSPLKFRQAYIEQMVDECALPPGAKILDTGCGPGELILALTKKGYDVWGVDISTGMVEEATKTLEKGGYPGFNQVRQGDVERLEFADESFDIVISSGVLEYQEKDGPFLSEMNRVLKKGGHLILNVTNSSSYVTQSEAVYLWLKRNPVVKRLFSAVKGGVLRKGTVSDFPWRRIHRPKAFDRELAAFGFRKTRHNYFRFSQLPAPFDQVFGSFSSSAGRYMERWTQRPIGFVGGGYLVCCKKETDLKRGGS